MNSDSGRRPARVRDGRSVFAVAGAGLILALVLLTGCASRKQMVLVQEDTQRIRADMDSLKREQRATREAITGLESEMRDLKARNEYGSSALEEKVEAVAVRLNELATRLNRALAPLEEFVRRQSASDTARSGALGVDYYDAAMRDLSLGNYDLAEIGFLQFLENNPQSELADDARFGLGETYYARKRYEEAGEEYRRAAQVNPAGGKTPAALLKLGLCYRALQNTREARSVWEDLIRRFPHSEEAKVAQQRLSELKGSN